MPVPLVELDAVAVFGGGMNVRDADRLPWMRAEIELLRDVLQEGVPVIGVCLGAQLLASAAGAEVRRSPSPEIGWFDVARCPEGELDPLFSRLPNRFLAYEWHSYASALPAGSVELARSAACPQAFRLGEHAWGVQFHPEVVPEIVREWALDYRSDPDAIAMGFDPPAHIAEAEERLPAWMELGRTLFDAFLTAASAAPRAPLTAAPGAPGPPRPRG
jgi:GMP synthase-like glutamine amidotransferase